MQKLTIKYYQNGFNDTIKGLYSMTKWDLSQGCKNGSISVNQSKGLIYRFTLIYINKIENKNHMITSIDAKKNI